MADAQLFSPGTAEYRRATQPLNSSGSQQPAFVATPRTADEVSAVLLEAARLGLSVTPQATGHGAGGDLGAGTIVLDTSGLNRISIDPDSRSASAGAGSIWADIDAQAEPYGLLGLAGSSPTVSVAGFTFGGGLGWLTRPHGMASSALHRVEYVDGAGRVRVAAEDAEDPLDRDALWVFRGGGGAGIATRLDFDLVPVPDLHAGYLLWPIDALDAVVGAWAGAMPLIGPDVVTSIAVLHLPPDPSMPEQLRGKPSVHLAVAESTGETGSANLLAAVRAAAAPVTDTWGPADSKKLGGIHLDPPAATPAIGDARWLGDGTPAVARDILAIAAAADSALTLIEIRNVGNDAPARPGAETTVPGPYLLHAVGDAPEGTDRTALDRAFASVRRAAGPVDLARSVGSWMEGAISVPDALPADLRTRAGEIADAIDPDRVLARSRYLA